MRQIGTLNQEELADRFGDFLITLKIAHSVEPGGGGWVIWVHDDDQLERAGRELAAFEANPSDARYANIEKSAERVRVEQEQESTRRAKNYYDVRTRWSGLATRARPLTLILIVICLFVGLATKLTPFDSKSPLWEWLSFASPQSIAAADDARVAFVSDLKHGEVWRLITPIFMHIGILHLLFNLLWLADLGGMIETRKGTLRLALIVLASGIGGCVMQNLWEGPIFAGMSGVVYALFGYCWMKGRFQPEEGMAVGQQTVMILMIWLVICMTGMIGRVANAAHLGGLVVGVASGYLPYAWTRVRRKLR